MSEETPRWMASINYRSNQGIVGIMVGFEEFDDLGDVIEQGPHWDTVESITITRLRDARDDLTIEQAAEL